MITFEKKKGGKKLDNTDRGIVKRVVVAGWRKFGVNS
jgi:hypothetical protein